MAGKRKRKITVRKLAEQIAERLFTDGSGRRTLRLVMDYENKTDMCGWSESCAADQIEKVLKAAQKGRK